MLLLLLLLLQWRRLLGDCASLHQAVIVFHLRPRVRAVMFHSPVE